MPDWLKLLTGLAATVLVARACTLHQGQALMAALSDQCRTALEAEQVADASVTFQAPSGLITRVARLSGTADAATRARVLAAVRRQPGIADATWEEAAR